MAGSKRHIVWLHGVGLLIGGCGAITDPGGEKVSMSRCDPVTVLGG